MLKSIFPIKNLPTVVIEPSSRRIDDTSVEILCVSKHYACMHYAYLIEDGEINRPSCDVRIEGSASLSLFPFGTCSWFSHAVATGACSDNWGSPSFIPPYRMILITLNDTRELRNSPIYTLGVAIEIISPFSLVFTYMYVWMYVPVTFSLFRVVNTTLSSSYNILELVPACWLLFQCF